MNTIKATVIYEDGTKIKLGVQEDGSRFVYEDIVRTKLSVFVLEKDEKELVKLHLDKDQHLIWRKRHYKSPGKEEKVIHLLGWQQKVKGENIQAIMYVFEDGHIEMAGKFRDDHPVFNKVELLKEEK